MAGQKSFRRKYNKIRWRFKGVYEENVNLHLEEQKLAAVSRRLREQNDQLLESLLDINESERVAKHLRYVLDPPTEAEVPELQADGDPSHAQAEQMLEEARQQVESGELMQRDYDILVAELKNSLDKPASVRSLPQLEETVSHTSLSLLRNDQIPDDIKNEEFSTYLDAAHEDAYLAQLDALLDGSSQPNGESAPSKPILSEATLKNPVSTYNWLREHKPEVFVQEGAAGGAGADKDKSDEKDASKGSASTPAAAGIKRESRAVKRASVVELLDDEGNLVGNYAESSAPASKSKRKREPDDAYRPKGGGSSSSAKKRKKSTSTGAAKVAPEAE